MSEAGWPEAQWPESQEHQEHPEPQRERERERETFVLWTYIVGGIGEKGYMLING